MVVKVIARYGKTEGNRPGHDEDIPESRLIGPKKLGVVLECERLYLAPLHPRLLSRYGSFRVTPVNCKADCFAGKPYSDDL